MSNNSKRDFGLEMGEGATPQLSIKAGIGIMFRKGLTTDGKTSDFTSWENASQRYNGGGAENYGNVLKMQSTAVTPAPQNYIPSPTGQ